MSRVVWHHVKRIFWFNFNKPHRKLGLVIQDKLQNAPRRLRRKLYIAQSNRPSQRLFLETAHKSLLRPLVSTRASRIFECTNGRSLHTTLPRSVPPVFWVFFKPVGKIWAMLWGRYIRKWWGKLPLHTRNQYLDLLGGMKGIIIGVAAILVVGVVVNYYVHLEENPLTGRRRFMSLTHDQVSKVAEVEEEQIMSENKFLKTDDPMWRIVSDCSWRILKANKEECEQMKKLSWLISVVDDDQTRNAFVLPNGHIFVYTGLLKDMKNTDQLAIIIGHEIAHAVMGHAIEHISRGQLLDFVMIAVLAAIWTVVPGDGIALVTQWFYNKLIKLMLDLPYSRELETEADAVGLRFAAKACYDIREAPALWALQEARAKYSTDMEFPEFMSTHPSHETRVKQLLDIVPQALEIRDQCACPKLKPGQDPFNRVNMEIATLKATYEAVNAEQEVSSNNTN